MDDSQDTGIEALGDGLVPQMGTIPRASAAAKHLVVIDELINWMILNPGLSVKKAAKSAGGPIQYSAVWITMVASSDAFRARLAEKQKEIDVHLLVPTLREKLTATCEMAVERVAEMIPIATDAQFVLDATEMLLEAQYKSYGGAAQKSSEPQNNFQIDRATFVLAEERNKLLKGEVVKPALTILDAQVVSPGGNDNA